MQTLADRPAVAAAIEGNLHVFWQAIGRLTEGALFEDVPEGMRFLSGVRHPLCNAVLRPRLTAAGVEARIADLMKAFEDLNLPMFWWLGPGARPENLATQLEARGLVLADTAPGMALDLYALPESPVPAGLEIRPLRGSEDDAVWQDLFAKVFELPGEAVAVFAPALARMARQTPPVMLHLLAWQDGEPAGCGSFLTGAGVGGVYNIGTAPHLRGRGIGRAITHAGLRWLRDEAGQRIAILQSSQDGLSVYRKLGFEEFCSVSLYTNPPPSGNTDG